MSTVVVAAPSVLAAETGAAVADMGGSSVDVAVAATLAAMCTEPGVCAPGGGGYLTIWPADADPISIDGYMAMPGKDLDPDQHLVSRTVSMEYGGGVTTEVGPASIAVPGGLAALDAAHHRFGAIPWSEVVGAVADALATGFPLPAACRYYLRFSGESVFADDPESRAALYPDGTLLDAGANVVVDGLVETLRHIGEAGAETFYRGDLARSIVDDLSSRGGRITRADLDEYRPLLGPPVISRIGGWTVATTPPPAIGGVTLSAILRISGGDRSGPAEWIEAQARVLGDERGRLELAPDRESAGWELLDQVPDRPTKSGATVSIAAAGGDGSVCAATMSGGYGSGVIPAGTGLWMNNSLGEIELNPVGIESLRPGERLMSNMAPTVAVGAGRQLAIGSPGADRITSALAITLTLIMGGAALEDAIEHPRAHFNRDTGRVAVEAGLDPGPISHPTVLFADKDMYFGGVTAAELRDGSLHAHADSRRTGGIAIGGHGNP